MKVGGLMRRTWLLFAGGSLALDPHRFGPGTAALCWHLRPACPCPDSSCGLCDAEMTCTVNCLLILAGVKELSFLTTSLERFNDVSQQIVSGFRVVPPED